MNTALLLGLCQMLFMAAAAVGISFSALVAARLAPSPALATFPFLFMTVSTALLTLVLPRLFTRFGYRGGFSAGAILGVAGGLGCAWAVWTESFWLFSAACALVGGWQASALYYRFAAADAVSAPQKSSALAWVMSGGVLAALVGPWLGSQSLNFFTTTYLGSYLLTAVLALLALPLFILSRLPGSRATTASKPPPETESLWRHPVLVPAAIFCAGGYGMMMFVMLATPLAIDQNGHSAEHAASVIQWHLLGMFAPSFFTGRAISRFGANRVALTGCALMAAGCAVALASHSLMAFHLALMWVGIAWNLMYMGGSTLLAQVTDDTLRGRLQALNEFTTFAVMTLTAGITGWFYHQLGWQAVLGSTIGLVVAVGVVATLSRGRATALPSPAD